MSRREQYRVSGVGKAGVRAMILWPSREHEDVLLIDSSAGGLKFRLQERSLSALKVDQEIEMALRLTSISPPVRMRLVVVRLDERSEGALYACAILENSELVESKSKGLWQLFNRRRTFRATAQADKSCPSVDLIDGDTAHRGRLLNISAGGLALKVSGDLEFEIGAIVSCTLAFDAGKKLTRLAEIKHRSAGDGLFALGLCFEPQLDGPDEDTILDYVSLRQVKMIDERNS